MASKSEREIAIEQQHKLQFYLISLVFTLLALAVQSAKLGSSPLDGAEIAGWVVLLVSGLSGLWYLEMNPTLRVKMAQRDELAEDASKLREALAAGQYTVLVKKAGRTEPTAPMLQKREQAMAALDVKMRSWERWQLVRYKVCKVAFVVGLVFLAVARAYPAFAANGVGCL